MKLVFSPLLDSNLVTRPTKNLEGKKELSFRILYCAVL